MADSQPRRPTADNHATSEVTNGPFSWWLGSECVLTPTPLVAAPPARMIVATTLCLMEFERFAVTPFY
jgi:hypothetical protein